MESVNVLLAAGGSEKPFRTYQQEAARANKCMWWIVGIAAFIGVAVIVGIAVGVRLGKRADGPSSSPSSATSNQNGTAGAVSSDPNDPSKFQKNPNLH
jgi:hypothetical protein